MNTYSKFSKIPKLFYLSVLFLALKYGTDLSQANDLLKAQLNVLNSRNLSENPVVTENLSDNVNDLRTESKCDENENLEHFNDFMMEMFLSSEPSTSSNPIQPPKTFTISSISDESDLDNENDTTHKTNEIRVSFPDDIDDYVHPFDNITPDGNSNDSHSSKTESSNENTPSTSSLDRNANQDIDYNSQNVINNEEVKKKFLKAFIKTDKRKKNTVHEKKNEKKSENQNEKKNEKKKKIKKKKGHSNNNSGNEESFDWNQSEEEIGYKLANYGKAKDALESWRSNVIERLHNNPSLSNVLSSIHTIKEIEQNHFNLMMLEEQNSCILLGKINNIPQKFIRNKWDFAHDRMRQEINNKLPKIFDDLYNYSKKYNGNSKDLILDIKMAQNRCAKLRGLIHKHNQYFFMKSIKQFLEDIQS